MDDVAPDAPVADRRPSRGGALTPRRVAAVIALVLLVFRLRRHIRFAREAFRQRRRLKLAFTVLALVRQLRRS